MKPKYDRQDVIADISLVGVTVPHTNAKVTPMPRTLGLLLHYSDPHSHVLHLHCTVCALCPQMVNFFTQTEQKQANGNDLNMKQPHSCPGHCNNKHFLSAQQKTVLGCLCTDLLPNSIPCFQ